MYYRFLDDQNQEECQKSWKKEVGNQEELKKQGESMACEISQQKWAAAKWAAKIPLLREIHPPLWKCSKL